MSSSCVSRLVLSCLLMSLLSGGHALAQGKDILCAPTNVRWDLPGECQRNCPVRITHAVQCALSPQCPKLKRVQNLTQIYHAAVFQTLGIVPPQAKEVLVAHIINQLFRPAHAGLFDIAVVNSITGWAEVGNSKNANGKFPLSIHPDLYWMSPAMMASTLGHELVHYYQYQRPLGVNVRGIDAADSVFREVEASYWETGFTGYTWPHGINSFFGCLLTRAPVDEHKNVADLLTCRERQAKKIIEDMRTSPRAGMLDRLEKYLKDNPFTNAVWLPRNPNWKTYTAGPKPSYCP